MKRERRTWQRRRNGQWAMGPHLKTLSRITHCALLSLMFIAPCSVFAISDKAGTSNGAFLKIPSDARGVGLGPAIVSMAEGTEAIRWNPAALGRVETKELATTHVQYYQDVAIENVSFVYPSDYSALAGSLFYLSPGTLEGRDINGNVVADFKFYDLVASVGYGRRVRSSEEGGPDVYLGGALKIAQEKIADTQTQNPAADAGLLVLPNESLRLALTLQNLSAGKADFPKQMTAGASYTVLRSLTGGIAGVYSDDAPMRFSAAGEYKFPDFQGAVVRLGYQTHDALDDSEDSGITALRPASLAGLTLGGGFDYRPPMFKTLQFVFDYGMAPFGALGISHTITLKIRW